MTYFLTHTLRQLRRRRRRRRTPRAAQERVAVCPTPTSTPTPAPCSRLDCLCVDIRSCCSACSSCQAESSKKEGRRRKKVCTHIFCSAADGVEGVAARVDIKILINPRTLPRPLSHSPTLCPCLFGLLHLTEKRQLGKSSGKSSGSPCGTHIAMRRRVKRKRRICVIATAPLPPLLCPLRPQLS